MPRLKRTLYIVERAIHEIWGLKASLFVDVEIRKISSTYIDLGT